MSNNEVDPTPEERLLIAIFGKQPERPKPGDRRHALPTKTVDEPVAAVETVSLKPKPKYVPKPHLTERPFQGNEQLRELQKQLHKSEPRRQSRTKKESK